MDLVKLFEGGSKTWFILWFGSNLCGKCW